MKPPTLPASPWQASPLPDSRAIITGDGYFLLNLEGLPTTPETAAALRRAVAALPDLLESVAEMLAEAKGAGIDTMPGDDFAGFLISCENARAALRKAGYTFPDDQKP